MILSSPWILKKECWCIFETIICLHFSFLHEIYWFISVFCRMDCSLNRFLENFQRVFKVKTFYNNTKTLSTFLSIGVLTFAWILQKQCLVKLLVPKYELGQRHQIVLIIIVFFIATHLLRSREPTLFNDSLDEGVRIIVLLYSDL